MAKPRRRKPDSGRKETKVSAVPGAGGALPLRELSILLGLVVIGLAIYGRSLHYPFHFDDEPNIIENESLRQLGNFLTFSGTRYVGYLSFALNYWQGGLEIFGFHVVNILVHLVNAGLVFGLLLLITKTPAVVEAGLFAPAGASSPSGDRLRLAAAGALLFLVHPIQSQAVVYIVQRFTSLAALFYLLALWGYLQWRLAPPRTKARFAWYVAALVATVLAMKTKEHTFTLPFAIVLVELTLFGRPTLKSLAAVAPFLLTLPIIPLSIPASLGEADAVLPRETADIGRLEYLFTQFPVIVTYLRLLVFPSGLNLDHDPAIYRTLWTAPVLLSLALLLALLGVAIAALFFKKYRLSGVGLLWFFLTLSIESSIIPIKDPLFEHRLYLPLFGIALALLPLLAKGLATARKPATIAVAVALGGLALTSYARTGVWKDDLTLWRDVVQKSPQKPRAHQNLGIALFKAKRYSEAIESFNVALRLKPEFADVYFNLGLIYTDLKQLPEAIAAFERTIRIQPDYVIAHNNLGNAYLKVGRVEDALRSYRLAMQYNPKSSLAYYNLGLVYFDQARLPEAVEAFEGALRLKPDHTNALNNLGAAYLTLGRLDKALEQYNKLIKLRPEFAMGRFNHGLVLARQGKDQEAVESLELAVRLAPDLFEAHQLLATTYGKLGRAKDAERELELAKKLEKKPAPGL